MPKIWVFASLNGRKRGCSRVITKVSLVSTHASGTFFLGAQEYAMAKMEDYVFFLYKCCPNSDSYGDLSCIDIMWDIQSYKDS